MYTKMQDFSNPRCQVAQVVEFGIVTRNICRTIIAVFLLTYRNVDQFTCTEHRAPDNSEAHRLLQNFGS